MSCPAPGDCTAGGEYSPGSGIRAFVVSEVNGAWGQAKNVPGLATLNQGDDARILSVSCASAGNCSAGGFYSDTDQKLNQEAFVVNQVNGVWGQAEHIPVGYMSPADNDEITSVSCPAAGDCTAAGHYGKNNGYTQGFVVRETDGSWGQAEGIPGLLALNQGDDAGVSAVSCASPGNCSAVGGYASDSQQNQAFVATETGGTWYRAKEVPGTATLNTGGSAQTVSVSCPSAGNCSAGGYYFVAEPSLFQQGFVVTEVNGVWGQAVRVSGFPAGQQANAVETLSCATAGTCSAGGYYIDGSDADQAFVVNETGGTWQRAEEVPGTATLNVGGNAQVASVSCATAGTCSAGGSYMNSTGGFEAFVVSRN